VHQRSSRLLAVAEGSSHRTHWLPPWTPGGLLGDWGGTGEALGTQWSAVASLRTRRNNTDSMPMYAPINMYPTTASEAANNLASGGGRTSPYPSVVHVTMEKYRQVIGSCVTFSPSIRPT
jgi:hypothetical protein